jgi:hypothetical protein
MARWNSCNILQVAPAANRLWKFDAKGDGFVLDREQQILPGQPLPSRWVVKSWRTLGQPKLNIAWLPPENVFLRVIELPKSSFEETQAMVELQLEKLSPLPVTQIVWTLHLLPAATSDLQSIVVVIAARATVEEFLGKLEKDGYLSDRLETPMLDQLGLASSTEDGAWIYAGTRGKDAALFACRSRGTLRNLTLLVLPSSGDRVKSLKEQLVQICWAGEMEGWLTEPPKWHLVADTVNAAEWENLLRAALDEPVRVAEPPRPAELAALTARRAATAAGATLLPREFFARYHQQFVDRLWLHGLVTTGILYAIAVVIYFCATTVLGYKTREVEQQVAQLGGSYTNVLQLKARYAVLAERQQLKYAALDCWKVVATKLPEGLSLQRSSFSDGKKLSLSGMCTPDQIGQISDQGRFYDAIRKAKLDSQDMFEPVAVEPLIWNQSGNAVNWRFTLQLKHSEAAP